MSEKEIKIENEITETPISEVTSPAKLKSKEETQNNKNVKTTIKEKAKVQEIVAENEIVNKSLGKTSNATRRR